ncbi:uncharacterized protein MELLADRAFT_112592 [Melampsora larici-populina 98AG31]|uniref:Uncharacterized protein n=1 Tax=Melampsora larici-populina (strain 98AG31 / pathotype 3-4-7) TaxID=747676 RepID=F4S6Z4_MELLP|nr:uncharacterized protein MELLADRAFT_112592 [Melampsora larici-populina 98AG31]EGF99596.1 hypothetical protein MELLADRAFT_112592 [Melampsora larici-populina 98AG31]
MSPAHANLQALCTTEMIPHGPEIGVDSKASPNTHEMGRHKSEKDNLQFLGGELCEGLDLDHSMNGGRVSNFVPQNIETPSLDIPDIKKAFEGSWKEYGECLQSSFNYHKELDGSQTPMKKDDISRKMHSNIEGNSQDTVTLTHNGVRRGNIQVVPDNLPQRKKPDKLTPQDEALKAKLIYDPEGEEVGTTLAEGYQWLHKIWQTITLEKIQLERYPKAIKHTGTCNSTRFGLDQHHFIAYIMMHWMQKFRPKWFENLC